MYQGPYLRKPTELLCICSEWQIFKTGKSELQGTNDGCTLLDDIPELLGHAVPNALMFKDGYRILHSEMAIDMLHVYLESQKLTIVAY